MGEVLGLVECHSPMILSIRLQAGNLMGLSSSSISSITSIVRYTFMAPRLPQQPEDHHLPPQQKLRCLCVDKYTCPVVLEKLVARSRRQFSNTASNVDAKLNKIHSKQSNFKISHNIMLLNPTRVSSRACMGKFSLHTDQG